MTRSKTTADEPLIPSGISECSFQTFRGSEYPWLSLREDPFHNPPPVKRVALSFHRATAKWDFRVGIFEAQMLLHWAASSQIAEALSEIGWYSSPKIETIIYMMEAHSDCEGEIQPNSLESLLRNPKYMQLRWFSLDPEQALLWCLREVSIFVIFYWRLHFLSLKAVLTSTSLDNLHITLSSIELPLIYLMQPTNWDVLVQ